MTSSGGGSDRPGGDAPQSEDEARERRGGGSGGSRGGAVYQGTFEAVLALLVATSAGWWLDRTFETFPLWLLVGLAFGFAAFVRRLWRMRSLFEAPPHDAGERSERK